MTDQTQTYVPGVCNINREEIAYRRKAGYFGLGLFVIVGVALVLLPLTRWIRIVEFVPAFIAAIGYLQTKNKFCVSYGASGRQNASEGSSAASEVTEQSAKDADRKKARRMNSQAAVISIIATAIVVALPHL